MEPITNIAATVQQMLSGLTSTADARTQAINKQADDLRASTAAVESLLRTNLTEAGKVAETAGQIATQKAETDYIRNSAIQRSGAILGMNADENNYIIPKRMAEYTQLEEERKTARQEYDKLAQTDLLTNPVGYIVAQLKLPSVAARNNAIVDARDAAVADIATRQNLAIANKSAVTANTADQLRTTALLEAKNAQAQAEIALRQAEAEMTSKMAGARMQEFQLRDKAFDVQGDLFSKQIQVQQFVMNFESLKAQREAARLAAEERISIARERAAMLKSQAEKDAIDAAEQAGLNAGFATVSRFLGMPAPMTLSTWKLIPDRNTKEVWLTAAQSGVLGDSVVEGLQFINRASGNTQVLRTTNPGAWRAVQGFTEALNSIVATEQRKPENAKAKMADIVKTASDQYSNIVVQSASNIAAKETLSSPTFDKLFNPYKAQHKVMIDQFGDANNVMVKALKAATVGREAEVASMTNLSSEMEQQAMASVIDQIATGKLGLDDAARQVNSYYTAAARKNFELYQYNLFGLPAQTNYAFRMAPSKAFGDVAMADLMDFASTKMALAAQTRQRLSPGTLGPMLGPLQFGADIGADFGDWLRGRTPAPAAAPR
jgi:hypothetical protein